MIQYSKVIEAPDNEPVSLDEAKDHLEVTGNRKNALITSLIASARRQCEIYAGLSFVTQRRRIVMDFFPDCGKSIVVPYGPVQSIDSFVYIDTNGDEIELVENTDFIFDSHSDPARLIYIKDGEYSNWPCVKLRPNAVTIEYTAGYDEVSGQDIMPEQIKTAILEQVAAMFENRQDEIIGTAGTVSTTISLNSKAILDTVKVYWNANY